jgi:hypothetical protein
MAFVGLVTRKDKPTGVSLMAKVVTANKKKSARKVFKVSVKPNGLDDFSCCVLDHAAAVDKINSSQNMSEIVDDMSLIYSGINGAAISYRIIDIGIPLLSTHLGEDGKVHGRPKYGEGDASGYIEITVTKGEASIVSRIQASVKAITANEVLNDSTFAQASLWTLIKGNNDSYQQGSEWSGHNNIIKPLTLIKAKNVDEMSKEPVTITWSVVDETLDYTNIYAKPRIDIATGAVERPTYKDACSLVDVISGVNIKVVGSNSNALQNRVRIGGLVLTATLTLGEASKKITFNCATISKYITNQEVMDVVLANIYINTDTGAQIPYKEISDSSFFTIVAPTDGGNYTLRAFGNRGSETFEAPQLKLKTGDIIGVTITNNVLDFNGSNDYADSALLVNAFNGGFQSDEGDTFSKLIINLNALKDADSSKKEFACGATISIAGYSNTGDTPGGSSLNVKRHVQFKVDTSAIVSAPATA